ncbi:MAG TPA: hypothetical protein VHU18_13380 [Rhizomicrobium sp.]|nr:hypothetical protein [Rhizomicrobium sp.]
MPKTIGTSMIAVLAAALMSSSALAHRAVDPLPRQARHEGAYLPPYLAPPKVKSGKWTPLKAGFPGTSFPDTALVLTDGTVLMHDGCTSDWYRLTPDSKGSYVTGTWKKAASMPSTYKPLYFSSAVLSDGRMIVEGGEYNSCNPVWTTLGALYDPVSDKWSAVNPPTGWSSIGDAQSVVLSDGTYLQANCCTADAATASISGNNVTWNILSAAKTGKADEHDEEGWTTLPGNTLLTVDANRDLNVGHNDVEIFSHSNDKWTGAGTTVDSVVDPGSHELGPATLLPTGIVFQAGATGHNDVYDTVSGKWATAPSFGSNDSADGPAVVLPNGHALFQVSPGVFGSPSHFYEAQANNLTKVIVKQVNEPASAGGQSSYEGRLLMLPTGQAFWTSDTGDIQLYTPKGHAKTGWLPTITSVPGTITRGSTNNAVQGTQFNGFTDGGYYGDDAQMATNFPLVRITNTGSGKVCYARTHDFSSRGVSKKGDGGTAQFDVPNGCDTGASNLEVVVNGIASLPSAVTVN